MYRKTPIETALSAADARKNLEEHAAALAVRQAEFAAQERKREQLAARQKPPDPSRTTVVARKQEQKERKQERLADEARSLSIWTERADAAQSALSAAFPDCPDIFALAAARVASSHSKKIRTLAALLARKAGQLPDFASRRIVRD